MKNIFPTVSLFIFVFLMMTPFVSNAQLYPVEVYAVTSLQPAQPGEEAARTIDGDINTMYHSKWNQVGVPDELNFYFSSTAQSISKIHYTPRQNQTNGIWTNVSVLYSTYDAPENFMVIEDELEWEENNEVKEIEFSTPLENVYAVRFSVHEAVAEFSSCAEMEFFSENAYEVDEECAVSTLELIENGANDVKVTIDAQNSTASSYQFGENIERSFDGDLSTLYHSSYGNTQFPVLLTYAFDGEVPIDYLKYYPRSDGGVNGNFGSTTILYNTIANSDYQELMEVDFDGSGQPKIVHFPSTITPKTIQIVVNDGVNDFVSCAEMEFYQADENSIVLPPDDIFSDAICSELLPTVTQNDIDAIASTFYRELAQCIWEEKYDKTFRVQEYEVFQPTQKLSEELKIGGYDQYENSTGILFEEGEKVALFVEELPQGATIALRVKDFAEGYEGADHSYILEEGINVFSMEKEGLGYISYYNNDLTLPKVKINIVSGKVNGYYQLNTSTESEWMDLLEGNEYQKIDLIGEYTHLVFHRSALKSQCPFDPDLLIKRYDSIVKMQRQQMGWFKYDSNPKNRQLAISDDDGGWYAGGMGIHLDLSWGVGSVTNPNGLDYWGIPHEFGHINQMKPDLNWIGTTEVTNNIYSVWADYQLNYEGVPYSRLEAEIIEPNPGFPPVTGGRINGAINHTVVNENSLQGTSGYDVFKVLVPFWQLELYYQVAGASKGAATLTLDNLTGTEDEIDYANWYGTVAEKSRNTNANGLTHGELLLNFVKNTCDAVEENLVDFFIATGFLRPVDIEIDDYGMGQLTITQNQIDDAIAEIEAKGYEKPVSPVIHYLSAHAVTAMREQLVVNGETGEGVSVNGEQLTVDNDEWENTLAFEVYDDENELLHVAIFGTGDLSLNTTNIHYPENAKYVYAVDYNGEKTLVYPKESSGVEKENQQGFWMYPNPINGDEYLHLKMKNQGENLKLRMLTIDGKVVYQENGNTNQLETGLNEKLQHLLPAVYFVELISTAGEKKTAILVRN